jgi:hypothetical protein
VCGAADGAPCTESPVRGVHPERLRANAIKPVPSYLKATRAANRARTNQRAARLRPHRRPLARPRGPHPATRGYNYPSGQVTYEVEFHDHLQRTRDVAHFPSASETCTRAV